MKINIKPTIFKNVQSSKWIRVFLYTGSAQLFLQFIGFVCGIAIVRILPVQEYAFYAITNTTLGSISILVDSGIAIGVLSQGGKCWRDRVKLGSVIATGLELKRKFVIFGIIISVPMLFFLLSNNGATILQITFLTLAMLLVFLSNINFSLLEIPIKLHQDISSLYGVSITSSLIRAFLTGLAVFFLPFASVAMISSAVAQFYGSAKLRRLSSKFISNNEVQDPVIREEILKAIKFRMPNALYLIISSQVLIWVISILGSSQSIAQLNAIARFSVLMGFLNSLFNILIVPRFAKLEDNRNTIIFRYLQINIFLIFTACLLCVGFWILTPQMLWVLGPQYSGLKLALVIYGFVCAVELLHSSVMSLASSRGMILHPSINISLCLSFQVGLIYFIDFNKIEQVLVYCFINSMFQLILWHIFFLLKISKKNFLNHA